MRALLPLLALAVALVCGYLWWRAEQRRRQALQAFSAAKGWQFRSEDTALVGRWQRTPFGVGDTRRARNVMTGADRGRPFVAFDYSYVTGSGKDRSTHRFAVVALGLPGWLPGVQVTPETLLGRASEAIGIGGDIALESEDFNRRFRVTAHDPKFASDVLTPRTMQALLQGPSVAWRIEGPDLLAWDSGECTPLEVLSRLDVLHRVVDGIPSFVWHDNGVQPGPVQPSEGAQ
jgi:hypothetical protein